MEKVNYTNNTDKAQHIGNVLVMPGAMRPVNKEDLPKPAPSFNANKFIDNPAKDVIATISDLDQDRLRLVLKAENKRENPRSTVIKAIDIELAKQGFNLSDDLAEYKLSLSSMEDGVLQAELLEQAECSEKLELVQQELAERADA